MRRVLLRTLAVFVVGAVILAGILYYASTVDSRPPTVSRVLLTQHLSADPTVALTTSSLEVDFSEAVDERSAEAAFAIEPTVRGSFSWSGSTMVFTPLDPLPLQTTFRVRVAQGIRDRAGNASPDAAAPFSFTTVGQPQVRTSDPADGASDVPLDSEVSLTFSTLMDTSSVTAALRVSPQLAYRLRWSGETVTIVPSLPLQPATRYTVRLDQTATDLAGTALGTAWSLQFSTAASGLGIATVVPADGSDAISVRSPIAVIFDRSIDPATVDGSALSIEPAVAGTVDLVRRPGAAGEEDDGPRMLRFQPSGPLPPNTTFTVSLAAGVTGVDGARLTGPRSWTFLTGAPVAALGNQVVFISARGGIANLWGMNSNGSGRRQLSYELSPVNAYAIAPDGRSFVVGDGIRLVELAADGSSRRVLTEDGQLEFDPSYAPDGGRIVFARADASTGASLGLWTREVAGGAAHQVEAPVASPTPGASGSSVPGQVGSLLRAPRYAPDGGAIAFVDTAGSVGILDLADGAITSAPFDALSPPVWTPDSRSVLLSGVSAGTLTGRALDTQVAVPALDPDEARLDRGTLSSLRIVRLDRGGSGLGASNLPVGVVRPAIDAQSRLAYIRIDDAAAAAGAAEGTPWLSAIGGTAGRLLLNGVQASAVSFTPDPDRVLLARAGAGFGGVWLLDIPSGRLQQLSPDGSQPRWVP